MQGRIDVIDLLLKTDSDGAMQKELDTETKKSPPSLVRVLCLLCSWNLPRKVNYFS